MNPETKVYFDPFDIDQRLADLGLTRQPFVTAAAENLAAFLACTPNHPPTFPGTAGWAEANRSLREGLTADNWTRKNETNLPLVVNEAGTMAITATSGDGDTGRKEGFPCTRSPKGPRIADAIRTNQKTFDFMEDPAAIVASMKVAGRTTWLFLICRDFERGELRYELSQPNHMAEDGHVDGWVERIIFPPTLIDTDDLSRLGKDDGGQSPEITVEIKKVG